MVKKNNRVSTKKNRVPTYFLIFAPCLGSLCRLSREFMPTVSGVYADCGDSSDCGDCNDRTSDCGDCGDWHRLQRLASTALATGIDGAISKVQISRILPKNSTTHVLNCAIMLISNRKLSKFCSFACALRSLPTLASFRRHPTEEKSSESNSEKPDSP